MPESGNQENPPPVPSIVIRRAEFDRRIRTDQEFVSRIAGFSAYSLSRLREERGQFTLVPSSLSGANRPRTHIELTADVYEQLYAKPPVTEPFPKSLFENRVYGVQRAADDILLEYRAQNQGQATFAQSTTLPEAFEDLALSLRDFPDAPLDRLMAMTRFPVISAPRIKVYEDLVAWFGSEANLSEALIRTKQRSGVQIVYGKKESFVDFVRTQEHEDPDLNSAIIYEPIPKELILNVIPLGLYEERHFFPRKRTAKP